MTILSQLRALGFDLSRAVPFRTAWRVRCSQCEALTINGVPTHERGCPNQTHVCRGCDAPVERRGAYCPDCLS